MISRLTALTNSALSFKGQRFNNNRTNISDDYYSCDEFISRSSNRHMEVPPRYANPPKGTMKTIRDAAVGAVNNHGARVYSDRFNYVMPSYDAIKDYNKNIKFFNKITRDNTDKYYNIRDSYDSIYKLSLGLAGANLLKKGRSHYEFHGNFPGDTNSIIFYDTVRTKSSVSSAYGESKSPVQFYKGHKYNSDGKIVYAKQIYDFENKIVYENFETLNKASDFAQNVFVLDSRRIHPEHKFSFTKHIGKPVMFENVEFSDNQIKASSMVVYDVDRNFVVRGATTYIDPIITTSPDGKEHHIVARYATKQPVAPFRADGIHYYNQGVEVKYEPTFGETFYSDNCLEINDIKQQAVHYIDYRKDEVARRPVCELKRVVNFEDIRK